MTVGTGMEAKLNMSDECPKRESMSIEEATYDKIKDQVVAKQKCGHTDTPIHSA